MAGLLTDAWLDDLETAAKSAHVDPDVSLVLQQVVPDGPDGTEVAYAVVVRGGRVHVERGRAAHPDLTFTQDRATAEAIHRGDLSAQSAFMQGALRLGGDLCGLLGRATALAAVDDVFASVRA